MTIVRPRQKKNLYKSVKDLISFYSLGGLVASSSEVITWLLRTSRISDRLVLTLLTSISIWSGWDEVPRMHFDDDKQLVSAEPRRWIFSSSDRTTVEIAGSCLVMILLCALVGLLLDNSRLQSLGIVIIARSSLVTSLLCASVGLPLDESRSLEIVSNVQEHWRKSLCIFIRMLTLEYTFAIAVMYVIDTGLSARGIREYEHEDEVRWTLNNSRYASMGGFIVRPPTTVDDGELEDLQCSLALSSMELLQMRRLGYLNKLPDIGATQRTNSKSFAERIAVYLGAWFLVHSLIRWLRLLPISPLEIIASVFATYMAINYVLLGNGFFFTRPSTTLSLWDAEGYWSSIEDDERLSKLPQTSPIHVSWIGDIVSFRLLPKALFDPRNMTFWLGLSVSCFISGTLQSIAWDYDFPTSLEHILWKASVRLSFMLSAGLSVLIIFNSVLLEALSSNRVDSRYATVGLAVR